MKKIKIGANNTPNQAKVKIHRSGLDTALAIPLIILVAIGGVITLKFSLAASASIYITVTDSVKHTGVFNIPVAIKNHNAGDPYCTSWTAGTDQFGTIVFSGCPEGVVFEISTLDVASKGYKINTGSPKSLGSLVMAGSTPYDVRVSPIDTDNDGVPNNTPGYPVDKCPNVAGTGADGCPPPVTPPTTAPSTPAPNQPAPGPTAPQTPAASTSNGKTSGGSTKVSPAKVVATSGDTVPPAAPANFTIKQVDGNLFLSWDPSSDNAGIAGYNIDRSKDSGKWSTLATHVSDAFYTDKDVSTSGHHYYYRIQAVDTSGNLSESILNDIDLTAASADDSASTEPEEAAPAAEKKNNTGLFAGIAIGIVMLLTALAATLVLVRRRLRGSGTVYGYDVSDMGVDAPVTPVSSSPHSSLKEMVMDDMQHRRQDGR